MTEAYDNIADIYELFETHSPNTTPKNETTPAPASAGTSPYGRAALIEETDRVSTAPKGTRNHTLNRAAFSVSQLVASGEVDETEAYSTLHSAALTCGLELIEIQATLASAWQAGTQQPRQPVDTDTWAPPVKTIHADQPAPTTPEELSQTVRERLPTIDWHQLWADDTEEEWIIEPILPARRLVAIYSPPKVGKSLLMHEVAAATAAGKTVLGYQLKRAYPTLYVDFENDPKGDIRPRLQAMGYTPDDLQNLHYLSFPNLAALDGEAGSRELMAAIQEYGCEVVIIDTISRAIKGEENENDTWLSFYRHTGLKLKQAGISLIRLDHTGKNEQGGQRGGSAKSGDVDAVWRLSKQTDTLFQLECEAARLPIAEKLLIIERKSLPHLHHEVRAEARKAVWEEKILEVNSALDSVGAERNIAQRAARELLKQTGVVASTDLLLEVLRRRKNVPYSIISLDLEGDTK